MANTYFSAHQTKFRTLSCFGNSQYPYDHKHCFKAGLSVLSTCPTLFPLLFLKQAYGSCITQEYMLHFSRLFVDCLVISSKNGRRKGDSNSERGAANRQGAEPHIYWLCLTLQVSKCNRWGIQTEIFISLTLAPFEE